MILTDGNANDHNMNIENSNKNDHHVVDGTNACINITHIMTAHIHAIRNLCHRHNNIMMTIVNNMHNKIVLCNA